jgi:hypothetical protein
MNSEKKEVPSGGRRVSNEDAEPDLEAYVPLSVRNARQMRRNMWPYLWMSFASVIILAAALAILTYRMGAQSCH